jgi:hypothetical protein
VLRTHAHTHPDFRRYGDDRDCGGDDDVLISRGFELEKALDEGTMLVFEMNGAFLRSLADHIQSYPTGQYPLTVAHTHRSTSDERG